MMLPTVIRVLASGSPQLVCLQLRYLSYANLTTVLTLPPHRPTKKTELKPLLGRSGQARQVLRIAKSLRWKKFLTQSAQRMRRGPQRRLCL